MNVVFADAFYFVAPLNRRDQHHEAVVEFSRNIRSKILTSDWVLMEVADALSTSECRPRIKLFVQQLRNSSACEIVPASRELWDTALEMYAQFNDKEWTLTDCTSFVLMRERGLDQALTHDHHFEQAGFVALLRAR